MALGSITNNCKPHPAGTEESQCRTQTYSLPYHSKLIETTILVDGSKRYRVVDLVEGGSASKHGVFKVRAEADAVCSTLNAEHPR